MNETNWNETSQLTPDDGDRCLVQIGMGVGILTWCEYYNSWSNEDDEYFCDKLDVPRWMPLPEPVFTRVAR